MGALSNWGQPSVPFLAPSSSDSVDHARAPSWVLVEISTHGTGVIDC